ncbi:28802_t:CDS:2 [Gigaspora margarita]|uniref:28802_t:CDS:1 n=1 Tax=Gigaspora margarita TaxID=4874 RepID=A0ABN7VZG3_GIGMA|nr:28802_t:CDS:2 [Gigaspora margarita]
MDLHKVTMRETQGCTIKGVHFIFLKRFYCIHSHTEKLKQKKSVDGENSINNDIDYETEKRNTHIENPIIKKKKIPICAFPNSAYYTYWEQMQLKYENDEEMLADRALFSHKNNVKYLYRKYHDEHTGAQNGCNMFSRLEEEIKEFNTNKKGKDGCKNILRQIKITLNIYMDTTAGLDTLNTPLTILSTSTPVGGLPLVAILMFDKIAATFTTALDIAKRIVPSVVFGK